MTLGDWEVEVEVDVEVAATVLEVEVELPSLKEVKFDPVEKKDAAVEKFELYGYSDILEFKPDLRSVEPVLRSVGLFAHVTHFIGDRKPSAFSRAISSMVFCNFNVLSLKLKMIFSFSSKSLSKRMIRLFTSGDSYSDNYLFPHCDKKGNQ